MQTETIFIAIFCSIIGSAWLIYMIIYVVRKCLEIQRVSEHHRELVEEFSEQVREFIRQHEAHFELHNEEIESNKLNEQYDSESSSSEQRIEIIHDDQVDNNWMTEPFENSTEDECVICLTTLKSNTIATKCYHKFHFGCIKKWEYTSKRCEKQFL